MKYTLNIIVVALLGILSTAQGAVVLSYDAADLALTGDATGVIWTPTDTTAGGDMTTALAAGSSVVTPSSSYFTRAVDHANTGNILSFHNNTGIDDHADFSFEVWVKLADLSGTNNLFETGGATSGTGLSIADGVVAFTVNAGGANLATTSTTLLSLPSDFIQLVGVIDVDTGISLYLNGALQNSDAATIADWCGANAGAFGRTDTNVARPAGVTGFTEFDGQLALARFYDTALSPAEVATAYTSTIPEPATLGLFTVFGGGLLFIRRRFVM